MKFLKLIVCVLFLLTLTACKDDTKDNKKEEVTESTKVEKDAINSDQSLDIVAPSDDEVIALTKNFVKTIFTESEALGGSDETPITEDQYDELAKALTSVATDDALQGMLKEVLLNLCYACDSNPFPSFYYFGKEDLTFSNYKLDGSNYSVEVSYANEMIDSLVQETMTFHYEDDVWKVQSYAFEFSALQDDLEVSQDVEVIPTHPIEETNTDDQLPAKLPKGQVVDIQKAFDVAIKEVSAIYDSLDDYDFVANDEKVMVVWNTFIADAIETVKITMPDKANAIEADYEAYLAGYDAAVYEESGGVELYNSGFTEASVYVKRSFAEHLFNKYGQ